ncbi:MAG TPA: hypothetical protein VMJ35_05095 [Dongiaceae bacterium]|nr:hypothetical protein [Dongiaceae bacterium]
MKKQFLRSLIALCSLAGTAMVAGAQAQQPITLKVDHAFVVAGKILPAGSYTVKRVEDGNPRVLSFSNPKNHISVLVLTIAGRGTFPHNVSATFDEIDGTYFLREVQTANDGFRIIPDRSEHAQIMRASTSEESGRD